MANAPEVRWKLLATAGQNNGALILNLVEMVFSGFQWPDGDASVRGGPYLRVIPIESRSQQIRSIFEDKVATLVWLYRHGQEA